MERGFWMGIWLLRLSAGGVKGRSATHNIREDGRALGGGGGWQGKREKGNLSVSTPPRPPRGERPGIHEQAHFRDEYCRASDNSRNK